jgi:hypothetical protein
MERRRHQRYPFARDFLVFAESLGRVRARGHDISARGFSFHTLARLSVGDEIVFEPKPGDDFEVKATVRNVRAASGPGFLIGAERHL